MHQMAAFFVYIFCALFIYAALWDLRYKLVPLWPFWLALFLGGLRLFFWPDFWQNAFWGLIWGGPFFVFINLAWRCFKKTAALGQADIWALAAIGLWGGPRGLFFCLALGSCLGLFYALLALWLKKSSGRKIPFVAALAVALIINFAVNTIYI